MQVDQAKMTDHSKFKIYLRKEFFGIIGLVIFILLIFRIDGNDVYSYEVLTHQNITQNAVNQAMNYKLFVTNFKFDPIVAADAIATGSIREDDRLRPLNHFFDPTNRKGLNVFSSVGKPSQGWGFNDADNEYSWARAREYMHIALTGVTPELRDENLHKMFRSVGQVMHLVQDLASPAHVRNDVHLPIGLAGDLYEHYALDKYSPVWSTGYPTVKVSQFSDFWNSPQGLAVFTNRNFISQGTNFDNFNSNGQLYYALPQINHITTKTEVVKNQFGVFVPVEVDYGGNTFQDAYTGETITNDRLTAFSVFDFEAQEILGERVYSLNDFTMESGANILVRRAVGYSAGLLDYFFRGEIDMAKGPNTAAQYVIQNKSGEPMTGTFSLYYDDTSDTRRLVTSWSNPSINPHSQSTPVTFTVPTSPQPKEKGKYILVFNGTLGNEVGAVAGSLVSLGSNDPRLYVHFTLWDTAFTLSNTEVYWDIEKDIEVNLSDIESVSFARNIRDIEDLMERTYTTSRYSILPCGPGGPEGEVVWSGPNPGKIFLLGVAAPFGMLDVIYKQQCAGDVRTTIFSVTQSDRLFGYSFVRGNALGYLGINILDFRSSSETWDLRTNGITTTNIFRNDSKFGIYLFTEGVLDSRIEGGVFTSINNNSSFSGTSLLFEGGAVTLNTFDLTRNWAVTVYGEHNVDNGSQTQRCGNLLKGRPDAVHVRIDSFNYDGTQLEHVGNKHLTNLGSFLVSQLDKCPSLEGLVAGTVVE